jgi:transforming growth factor-beta-induced protein
MLLTLTATSALALAPLTTEGSHTIVDTAKRAGGFETLLAAVNAAGLTSTLMGDGPFTVFAPNDEAFAELGHSVGDLLQPENRELLTDILTYHVVAGELQAAAVVRRNTLDTLNGQRLNLGLLEGDLYVQNARVLATDVDASNGVIHVIDTVLQPTTDNLVEVAGGAGKFELLLTAAKASGLADSLVGEGPYTVLAPTDEAFRALGSQLDDLLKPENRGALRRILSYHVIPGRAYADQALALNQAETLAGPRVSFRLDLGRLKVDDARIVATDIEAANGVVHVIDRVLIPPAPQPVNGRLLFGYTDDAPSAALAAQLGLDRDRTRVVTSVTPDTNAQRDGLRRYDILLTVDGAAATTENVDRAKREVGFGGFVEFELIRGGQRQKLLIQVGIEKH